MFFVVSEATYWHRRLWGTYPPRRTRIDFFSSLWALQSLTVASPAFCILGSSHVARSPMSCLCVSVQWCVPTLLPVFQCNSGECLAVPSSCAPWNNIQICLGNVHMLLLLLQPFYDPLSGTTRVSRYQKDKPLWILLKQTWLGGSGIVWTICKLNLHFCSRR